MPKISDRKRRGKYVSYNKETLQKAVDAIRNGTMSFRKAEKTFEIPRSTLENKISGKSEIGGKMGRKPALPESVENKIVATLKEASRQGIGISRQQLLRRTGELCKRLRVSPFKKIHPSKDWWTGLKRRHPELSIRKAEKLGSCRAKMTNPVVINNYFEELQTLLTKLDLHDKPSQIWNCDETGRSFEHNPVRVIADKGSRNVVGKTSNSRTNITIMACVNAIGSWMPPMFVAKGKTTASIHGFNTEAAPPGTMWSFQPNGWMTDELGDRWFSDIFLKHCGPQRPQVLILDGHSSHESLAILENALANDIHILSLPPHTTHVLQPLDRAVFGPFSTAFNAACSNFMAENVLNTVNKWSFPGLVTLAWEKSFTVQNIQSAFRACGIYPFDRSVVLNDGLLCPSKPTDRELPETPVMPTETLVQTVPVTETPDDVLNAESDANETVNYSSEVTSTGEKLADEAGDAPILDDPELLLQLINDGTLSIVKSSQQDDDEMIVDNADPRNEVPTTGLWSTEIDNLFLPQMGKQSISTVSANASSKKRNTSHRLLTSDDVIKEKREVAQRKEEKSRQKLEREQKKLSKKEKSKNQIAAHVTNV